MKSRKTRWAIENFSPARHLIEEEGNFHKKNKALNDHKLNRDKSMKLRTKQPSPEGRALRKNQEQMLHASRELSSLSFISSHDLQEPLRKIQTFSSRILEKEQNNLSDNGKECLKRVQLAARRMQMLIEDLVTYTKVNTTEAKFQVVKPAEVIEDVKTSLHHQIVERGANIEYSGITEAKVIPYQFYLLLFHLVSNSLKFADPSRRLQIKVHGQIVKGSTTKLHGVTPNKKFIYFHIKDNGIGFDEQFNERIFEVFQRLHTKDEYEGTGIGLAICRKIAENHKGFIKASGNPNEGASFDIFIPLRS